MLRLIGMALFAVLMCANFASCSSSDELDNNENNGEGAVAKTKKLLEMSYDDYSYKFTYDNDGKLSSIKYKERNYELVTIYTWDGNTIKEVNEDKEGTYTLENGLLTSLVENWYDWDIDNYTYSYNSSKKIAKIIEEEDASNTSTITFTWDGDKLIKFQDDYKITTYKYRGKTCKGWVPIHSSGAWHYFENNEIIYAHPQLVGLCSNQLPDESETVLSDGTKFISYYTYKFDEDGYVIECTDLSKENTNTYSYKWE